MSGSLRRFRRAVGDVVAYWWATGNWWMPAVMVMFAVTAIVVVTVKTAVPTAVYVFF